MMFGAKMELGSQANDKKLSTQTKFSSSISGQYVLN